MHQRLLESNAIRSRGAAKLVVTHWRYASALAVARILEESSEGCRGTYQLGISSDRQARTFAHWGGRLGSEQDGLRHETWASKNTERRVSAHASTTTDASFEEGSGGGTASTGRSELVESRRPEVVCTRRSGKGSRKTGRLGEWIAKHHTHKSVQTDFQV